MCCHLAPACAARRRSVAPPAAITCPAPDGCWAFPQVFAHSSAPTLRPRGSWRHEAAVADSGASMAIGGGRRRFLLERRRNSRFGARSAPGARSVRLGSWCPCASLFLHCAMQSRSSFALWRQLTFRPSLGGRPSLAFPRQRGRGGCGGVERLATGPPVRQRAATRTVRCAVACGSRLGATALQSLMCWALQCRCGASSRVRQALPHLTARLELRKQLQRVCVCVPSTSRMPTLRCRVYRSTRAPLSYTTCQVAQYSL